MDIHPCQEGKNSILSFSVKITVVKIIVGTYTRIMLLGYMLVLFIVLWVIWPEKRPKVRVQKRRLVIEF